MKKLFLFFAFGVLIASCGNQEKSPTVATNSRAYDELNHKFLIEPIKLGYMDDSTTMVYFFDFDAYDASSVRYFPQGGKDEMYLAHFDQFAKAHRDLEFDSHQPALDKKGMLTFWVKKQQKIEFADDIDSAVSAGLRAFRKEYTQ